MKIEDIKVGMRFEDMDKRSAGRIVEVVLVEARFVHYRQAGPNGPIGRQHRSQAVRFFAADHKRTSNGFRHVEYVTIGVQVNGKTTGTIRVPLGASEEVAINTARMDPTTDAVLDARTIARITYKANKILQLNTEAP